MKPWLRQGIWLVAALIVPVLLSLALLPLRDHVSDVLIALILLTVSAAAVARGELLLSLVAAASTALSFDYFFTVRELREKAERYAEELAERQRQVEQLAAELTASRRRILAVGDQMRRRIERDLHDGVQQHLVTLSLMLRVIRDRAPADVRADVDEVCDRTAPRHHRRSFIRTDHGACPARCEPTQDYVPAEAASLNVPGRRASVRSGGWG